MTTYRNGVPSSGGGSAADRREAALVNASAQGFNDYTQHLYGTSPKTLEALLQMAGRAGRGALTPDDTKLLQAAFPRETKQAIAGEVARINALPPGDRATAFIAACATGNEGMIPGLTDVFNTYESNAFATVLAERIDARSAPREGPVMPTAAKPVQNEHTARRDAVAAAFGPTRSNVSEGVMRHRVANVMQNSHDYLHQAPMLDGLGRPVADTRSLRSVAAAAFDLHESHRIAEQELGVELPTAAEGRAVQDAEDEAQYGDGVFRRG